MALLGKIITNLLILALMALAGYLFFTIYVMSISTPVPTSPKGTLSLENIAPTTPAPAAEPTPAADPAPTADTASPADPAPAAP